VIIGIDIDDTILNLLDPWILAYNKDYNDNLKRENIIDWKFDQFVKEEAKFDIYNYINSPDIFENAKPIKWALEVINYLKSLGHRIIFITANNPDNIKQWWLGEYGFWNGQENFVLAYDKSLITTDFLIDDKFENVQNAQGIGILFNQYHNQKYKWDLRANNWKDVLNIIEGWSEPCTL
jgi:5'(3')-deoxyribonucleotidase